MKTFKEFNEDCWDGYKQVGMKKKNGKKVPNCVPEVAQDKDIKDREGTQPAKYYAGDMSKSTKAARARHFDKKKKGPAPGDASAKTKPSKHTKKYKQMFGEGKKRYNIRLNVGKAKYTISFHDGKKKHNDGSDFFDMKIFKNKPDFEKYEKELKSKGYVKEENLNEKIEGLKNKAEKSGISYGILKKVYDRGMAAFKTGHRPGASAQQWAFARVNSFITKGKGTWGGADKDLASKARK